MEMMEKGCARETLTTETRAFMTLTINSLSAIHNRLRNQADGVFGPEPIGNTGTEVGEDVKYEPNKAVSLENIIIAGGGEVRVLIGQIEHALDRLDRLV